MAIQIQKIGSFSKIQISVASYVSANAKVVNTHLSKSEFCVKSNITILSMHRDRQVIVSMCDDDDSSLIGISPKDVIVTTNFFFLTCPDFVVLCEKESVRRKKILILTFRW